MKNPLPITNIGDPYVLLHGGVYYLYATSHERGYFVWTSPDLQTFSEPVLCYQAGARSFGGGCFWAPEVYEFGGRFYMYYTAQWKIFAQESLRIGVAVSDSPLGPFLDAHDQRPMFDFGYGVLDAHVLKDGARSYLYYSSAGEGHVVDGCKEADIYVVELGDDFLSVKGEGRLIIRPEQEWERKSEGRRQLWAEGPFVVKHQGRYHLMYSANFYASRDYCVGCAVADHPMGPFAKYPRNPVLRSTHAVSGPGHNSVTTGPDGGLVCVYHAHTHYDAPSGDRQVYASPMRFEGGYIAPIVPAKG